MANNPVGFKSQQQTLQDLVDRLGERFGEIDQRFDKMAASTPPAETSNNTETPHTI